MRGTDACCLMRLIFGLFLCSGSTVSKEPILHAVEREVTNPITTVPLVNLTLPPTSTPLTTTSSTGPTVGPAPTTAPSSSSPSESWCVASQSASVTALQAALDYACGHGGTDCSAIQPVGRCYEPNTVRDHAAFAFNSFYQKNPVPTSCNFGGTAVITSTDPSSGKCHYPSTSTSSSILNTTNGSGSTVFGAQPSTPYGNAAATSRGVPNLLFLTLLVLWRSHPHF